MITGTHAQCRPLLRKCRSLLIIVIMFVIMMITGTCHDTGICHEHTDSSKCHEPTNKKHPDLSSSWWCERCLLITESPKTPGHYRYLIWVLGYIPYMGLAVFSFSIARVPVYTAISISCKIVFSTLQSRSCWQLANFCLLRGLKRLNVMDIHPVFYVTNWYIFEVFAGYWVG